MAKPFIGIKRLWYGPELTAAQASTLIDGASVKTLVTTQANGFTEIKNVHDGTWGYSQDDPSVTDYVNELTGKPYYRDKTSDGARTVNFTLGVFEFKQKADLQGGSVIMKGEGDAAKAVGWKSDGALENVEKCIVAMTKTGNYIIFADASIIAKGDQQEKNVGLGITAVCMESEFDGVEAEYMIEGSTEWDAA